MKKSLSLLFGILITLFTVFLLASCTGNNQEPKEPSTADELYERIEEKMQNTSSYTVDEVLNAVIYANDIKLNLTTTSRAMYDGINTDDFYYYTDSTFTMDSDEITVDSSMYGVKTYQNGRLYSYTDDDTVEQKIFTVMTNDEFIEYLDESSNVDLDVYDASKRTFKKKDGVWILDVSGFSKKSINTIIKKMGLDDDLIGLDPMDIEMTFEANENYVVETVTTKFVFEENRRNVPSFEVVDEYSYGNIDRIIIDSIGYKEMDIRVLDDIAEHISDFKNSNYGSIRVNNTVTVSIPNRSIATNEESEISYGEDSSGFWFTMDMVMGGTNYSKDYNYEIEYSNGVQTVTLDGESEKTAVTESAAKATIAKYIDPASFNKYNISNLIQRPNGNYVLTVSHVDESKYISEYYTPLGATLDEVSEKIEITMKDGKITRMDFSATAYGHLPSDSTYKINVYLDFTVYF